MFAHSTRLSHRRTGDSAEEWPWESNRSRSGGRIIRLPGVRLQPVALEFRTLAWALLPGQKGRLKPYVSKPSNSRGRFKRPRLKAELQTKRIHLDHMFR